MFGFACSTTGARSPFSCRQFWGWRWSPSSGSRCSGSSSSAFPSALYAGAACGVVVFGLLGTFHGAGLALEAVQVASREMTTTLANAGLSVALYTTVLGGWLGGFAAAIAAVVAAGARVARVGASTLQPLAAVPLVVGVLAALGLALWSGVGAALVACSGGLAVALASARLPTDEAEHSGIASVRLGVAGIAAVGGLAFAMANRAFSLSLQASAMAHASAEMKGTLVAEAVATYVPGVVGPLVAAGLVMLSALAMTAPVASALRGGRTLAHGGLMAVVLAATTLCFGLVEQRMQALTYWSISSGEHRQAALEPLGVALAETTALRPHAWGPTLTVSTGRVWVEGEVAEESLRDGFVWPVLVAVDKAAAESAVVQRGTRVVNLEADAAVRMKRLLPLIDAVAGAGFNDVDLVASHDEQGLVSIRLVSTGEAHPDAGAMHEVPAGLVWFGDWPKSGARRAGPRLYADERGGGPVHLALHANSAVATQGADSEALASPEGLREALERVRAVYPDEQTLLVEPGPEVTVATLIAWLDAARDTDEMQYGRPLPLFPNVVILTEPLPPPPVDARMAEPTEP